jgi:hypothetical protein
LRIDRRSERSELQRPGVNSSAIGKARKRTAAKKTAKPVRKPAAKARAKRAGAKKAARSKVRQVRPQTAVAAETQIVDAFEEPVAEVEERGPDSPEPPDEKPS